MTRIACIHFLAFLAFVAVQQTSRAMAAEVDELPVMDAPVMDAPVMDATVMDATVMDIPMCQPLVTRSYKDPTGLLCAAFGRGNPGKRADVYDGLRRAARMALRRFTPPAIM